MHYFKKIDLLFAVIFTYLHKKKTLKRIFVKDWPAFLRNFLQSKTYVSMGKAPIYNKGFHIYTVFNQRLTCFFA